MNQREYMRFNQRFYRGYSAPPVVETENEWCERVCGCGKVHLGKREVDSSKCFDCMNVTNPYAGVGVSIEVGCEDSKNPQRIAEGTAGFNLGLRGVDTVVGKNPDGTPKLAYRPITNNELATARARREYAKRTNCTPQEETVKRAVGGK